MEKHEELDLGLDELGYLMDGSMHFKGYFGMESLNPVERALVEIVVRCVMSCEPAR